MSGTDACYTHAGKTLERQRAEGRLRLEAAAFELGGGGVGREVNPHEFVLELTGWARARLLLVSGLVAEMARAELAVARRAAAGEGDDAGAAGSGPSVGPPGAGALVGHRFVLGRDGRRVVVGEATRGLAAYELAVAELGARFAKTAIDARLVEAQVDLAQVLGGELAGIVDRVVAALGHDPEDPGVADVVRLALAGGEVAEEETDAG